MVSKFEYCLIFSTIHVASQERNLYPKISDSILSYPFSFQLMEIYYSISNSVSSIPFTGKKNGGTVEGEKNPRIVS